MLTPCIYWEIEDLYQQQEETRGCRHVFKYQLLSKRIDCFFCSTDVLTPVLLHSSLPKQTARGKQGKITAKQASLNPRGTHGTPLSIQEGDGRWKWEENSWHLLEKLQSSGLTASLSSSLDATTSCILAPLLILCSSGTGPALGRHFS